MNVQFFDHMNFCSISVISGVRTRGRVVDSHMGRTYHGFLYVHNGEQTFLLEGMRPLVVTGGALLYLPKGEKYRMEYTGQSTTFVLVNFELKDENGADILLFEHITSLARDEIAGHTQRVMTSFELCSASRNVGAMFRKKELLYRLLGLIFMSSPHLALQNAAGSPIMEGVALLEATYLENLPIHKYAEASHISENTFRRLFQKQFGTSPLKYRNSLRVGRARELLLEGGFTISEVAYASGFDNIGYFCRCYQQLMGETPGKTKRRADLSMEEKKA